MSKAKAAFRHSSAIFAVAAAIGLAGCGGEPYDDDASIAGPTETTAVGMTEEDAEALERRMDIIERRLDVIEGDLDMRGADGAYERSVDAYEDAADQVEDETDDLVDEVD